MTQGSRVQIQPSFCTWGHPIGHLRKILGRERGEARDVRKALLTLDLCMLSTYRVPPEPVGGWTQAEGHTEARPEP